jgi:arabinan endo-1,5-alpha-L-arabinosidase
MPRPARRWFIPVALLAVAALVLGLVYGLGDNSKRTANGTIAAAKPQLPKLTSAGATPSAGDLGDPALLTVPAGVSGPARYILFGTGDWPSNVPTAVSTDLKTWTPSADALPTVPTWSATDKYHSHIWAPAVRQVGKRWLLYVTVPDRKSGRQCIAVAASSKPEGPYLDAIGHALVCQAALGGSIDPSVVNTAEGPVLLWKSDGNCCKLPATLWSQSLRADGLGVTGVAHPLLTADQKWQQGVIEEPAAVPKSSGGWWLFYSGGFYNGPSYAIGIASCTNLTSACVDQSPEPYAASLEGQRSPGGLETFFDLEHHLRAVFDTWTRPLDSDGHYHCCRAIDLADLSNL